jgi:MFS family permease
MSIHGVNAYSCEIYPTKIRENALGLFYFSSRIWGFISNLIVILLLRVDSRWNYYINFVIGVLGLILTISLPIDTYRRVLDTSIKTSSINIETPSKVELNETSNSIEML